MCLGCCDQRGVDIAINAVSDQSQQMNICRGYRGSYSSCPCVWQFSKLSGGLFSFQSEVTCHSSLPSKQ